MMGFCVYQHGRNCFERLLPLTAVRWMELKMSLGYGVQPPEGKAKPQASESPTWPSPHSAPTGLVERLVVILITLLRFFSLGSVISEDPCETKRPNSKDLYVCVSLFLLTWLLFDTSVLGVTAWWPTANEFRLLISSYIAAEAFVATIAVLFVNRHIPGREPQSSPRSIVLLLVAYVELIFGFAVWYCYFPCGLNVTAITPGEATYFSTVTITTLGYGEIHPLIQPGQTLVITQVIAGFVLLGVMLATFVSMAIASKGELNAD